MSKGGANDARTNDHLRLGATNDPVSSWRLFLWVESMSQGMSLTTWKFYVNM